MIWEWWGLRHDGSTSIDWQKTESAGHEDARRWFRDGSLWEEIVVSSDYSVFLWHGRNGVMPTFYAIVFVRRSKS